MAQKYFGTLDVVGKTIPSRGYDVTVTGVIRKPSHCHLQFDFLVPVYWLTELGGHINAWNERFHTYIELKQGTDPQLFDEKIRPVLQHQIAGSHSEILLQPATRIHLYSSGKYKYDDPGHGNILYVRIMTLITVLIILIACLNFMNLSIAQSVKRAKETAIRKLSGANKRKIIFQYAGESLLLLLIAHILAVIMVELLLPAFNHFTGKNMGMEYGFAAWVLGLIFVIILLGIISGAFPPLYVSPLQSLGKRAYSIKTGHARFRRILVIFQFTLSITLIICALVIRSQLSFLQHTDLGFNKDFIGYFMFPTRPTDPRLESLKRELEKLPGITAVSKGDNPVDLQGTVNGFGWTGKKPGNDLSFYMLGGDANYTGTFQFRIKKGRFHSTLFSSDSSAVVINEKAALEMDFHDPVGEMITAPWGSKYKVIGVVQDFHFKSLHYRIEPLLMLIGNSNTFYVRMKPGNPSSTVESVRKVYLSFDPGLPLDFHFLEKDYSRLYRMEQRMSLIFDFFSFLTIFISCLGLVGLSSFLTEGRTKEIGIRKANGARSQEVFIMLLKEFLWPVFIALLIAVPAGWYAMHTWMQNFAYHIPLRIYIFILSGVIALVIAILSVSIQSRRAASKNPVDALRYE
jgi:putative ABC transport system permease protein